MRKYVILLLIFILFTGAVLLRGTSDPRDVVQFDVVIPCAEKDVETLQNCIEGIRNYGIGVRRIIVISKDRYTQDAEWVSESQYPFSKESIALEIFHSDQKKAQDYLQKTNNRLGWLFQQLVKLYSPFVIDSLLPNIFVLDADTIFLNRTTFFDEEGTPFCNISTEDHPAYFAHAKRLVPALEKGHSSYTGIAHCMIFQRDVLEALFEEIRREHQMEPWQAFCACIDEQYLNQSPASEYQIYFHYALMHQFPLKMRPLKWRNTSNIYKLSRYKRFKYNYVTCHEYLRRSRKENLQGKEERQHYF